MANKYHVNSDGDVRPCNATVKDCPVGGNHYETAEEAIYQAEIALEEKYEQSSVKKSQSTLRREPPIPHADYSDYNDSSENRGFYHWNDPNRRLDNYVSSGDKIIFTDMNNSNVEINVKNIEYNGARLGYTVEDISGKGYFIDENESTVTFNSQSSDQPFTPSTSTQEVWKLKDGDRFGYDNDVYTVYKANFERYGSRGTLVQTWDSDATIFIPENDYVDID